jgi:MFS family permease
MTIKSKNIYVNWFTLVPLSLFLFFDFVQLNIMSSVGPIILKMMPISTSTLGIISSLFFLVNLLLLFPAGIILDKYNVKWPVVISIFITILGICAFAFKQNICTLAMWRIFSGFAGAFSYISCVKLLSNNFPQKYLGLLLGLTGIVIMSAGVAVQYPFLKLIDCVGLSKALYLNAGLGFITIYFLHKSISENLIFSKKAININKNRIFLNPKNILIGFYACLTNLPLFVLGALWGNLYLIHTHAFTLETASLITSLIFVGNMIGAPSLGLISDKFKNRIYLMIVCGMLMFLSSGMIISLQHSQSITVFAVLFFILGYSTGSQTLAYALVVDTNHSMNVAKATSILSFLSVSGGAIAQPVFGLLIRSSHNVDYHRGMFLILVAGFLATLLALTLMFKAYIQKEGLLEILSTNGL